jgi:Iap family predicted aminopeptidase
MAEQTATNLSDLEAALLGKVSTEHLMEHTRTLAQWEKTSGTPAEREAVAYIAQRLREYGFETTEHEFDSLLGWPEEAHLEVRHGDHRGEIRAITHSFAQSTDDEGLEGEVLYLGKGQEADYVKVDAAGRIVLVEGIAAPGKVLQGVRNKVAAMIFIQEDRLHEMCVSPVWGTPTPRTAELLPNMPVVSVLRVDGELLKAEAAGRGLRVWMRTRTFFGWRPTPVLVGELRGTVEPEKFVLFSGHHCSWYFGAMDNGAANATMLEVARILHEHRDQLRRTVRIVFWPGHTHGRYSGSTWYFDEFWEDLHDHCVLHVNADSTGARGADIYRAASMPETREFAVSAVRDAIGEEAEGERQSRAGDQSFWGTGVPSVFMDLSNVPIEMAAHIGGSGLFTAGDQPEKGAAGHRPSGFPWWWHTPDDTIDKIDPEVLRKDTQVYLLTTLRAASEPLLPFRYAPAAAEIRETIERYAAAAGERVDLGSAVRRAREVEALASEIDALVGRARAAGEPANASEVNRWLMAMDRELVLLNFTAAGPFDQDLAVPVPPVPLLEPARRLAALPAASNDARFLATEVTRNRNKAMQHLRRALEAGAAARAALGSA